MTSGPRRWLRLDVTWSRSAWLVVLRPGGRLAWVELLGYVKAMGVAGRAKAMAPVAASRSWGIAPKDVTAMLESAHEDDALKTEDGDWIVTGWMTYQDSDHTAAERMRRLRSRNDRNVTRNNRNRTRNPSRDSDLDLDLDLNPELPLPRKAKRKPSALPDDWAPTAAHRRLAEAQGVDVDSQAERFRTHAETHDRRVSSWNAAFKGWLLKAPEMANGNGGKHAPPKRRVAADGTILTA